MIVSLGGRTRREAARMLSALAASLREGAPRTAAITPASAQIERERMRSKIQHTADLTTALERALDEIRGDVFRAIGFREGAKEKPDLAALSAGLDRLGFDERRLSKAFRAPMAAAYRDGVQSAHRELSARFPDKVHESGYTQFVADFNGQPLREADDDGDDTQPAFDLSFDVVPQAALDALNAATLKFSKDVVDREKIALKRIIMQALANGASTADLIDDIGEFFDDGVHYVDADGEIVRTMPRDSWIQQVARTEISRAANQGAVDTYRRAGVETLMWLTAEDERVCPECDDLDGAIVALGDPFPGTDATQPPEHPSCRCTVVSGPDLPPEGE